LSLERGKLPLIYRFTARPVALMADILSAGEA
jgi:hypothetical protein